MMGIKKPFHRIYRPVISTILNSWYSSWAYINDHKYCNTPTLFVRPYLMIQDELMRLFEYIEPDDININTYSYRIHNLFIRTCIELEANFRAILKENSYSPKKKNWEHMNENEWSIKDFYKVNKSHFLSDFSVEIPIWKWENHILHPFSDWSKNSTLSWYWDYNQSKHDRVKNFSKSNLKNLLLSVTWLFVLLSSQFYTESFETWNTHLSIEWYGYYKWNFWIGNFFIIKFPNYPSEEMYKFDWEEMTKLKDRFQKYDYNIAE